MSWGLWLGVALGALMLLAVCAGAGGVLATVFFHRRGAARGEKDQDSGGGSGDS